MFQNREKTLIRTKLPVTPRLAVACGFEKWKKEIPNPPMHIVSCLSLPFGERLSHYENDPLATEPSKADQCNGRSRNSFAYCGWLIDQQSSNIEVMCDGSVQIGATEAACRPKRRKHRDSGFVLSRHGPATLQKSSWFNFPSHNGLTIQPEMPHMHTFMHRGWQNRCWRRMAKGHWNARFMHLTTTKPL